MGLCFALDQLLSPEELDMFSGKPHEKPLVDEGGDASRILICEAVEEVHNLADDLKGALPGPAVVHLQTLILDVRRSIGSLFALSGQVCTTSRGILSVICRLIDSCSAPVCLLCSAGTIDLYSLLAGPELHIFDAVLLFARRPHSHRGGSG